MFSLEGKSALITGGSRGIGLQIARAYSESGATVTITGRDRSALDAAAASIGGSVFAVAGAVDDDAVVREAVETALAATGRVDILVNNAGGPPAEGALIEAPISDYDSTIAVNLRAPLLWSREAWRRSLGEYGGVILNIGSIGGLSVPRGMGAYAIAKAGLLHMTRVLAAELAPKVRVNAIAPGMVRTPGTAVVNYDTYKQLVPMGRVGEPADIAAVALFLASDEAQWITGETVTVDGGGLLWKARLPRLEAAR